MPEILKKAARVARVLTGRQTSFNGLTVFPDDVFLTSYPRSGNTWTRFMVGNLMDPSEPSSFLNIERRVAEVSFHPDHWLRRLPRPRLLKSHAPFDPRYRRIIYVVRDPRDVAVSFYHHNVKQRNLPDDYPIDQYVPRFINAEFDTRSGSWGENVLSWLALRNGWNTFLLVRYEDLKQNPVQELSRIAQFLKEAGFRQVDTSSEGLARAIELSSSERMRKMEKEQSGKFQQTKHSRQDKPFVRSATTGGWKQALSETSVAQIEAAWAPIMLSLGYELTQKQSPGCPAISSTTPLRSPV